MEPEDELQLKEWLVELRDRAGLSQQQVADEIGVERKTVYNAESPKQGNVSGLTLFRMLRLYGALADPPSAGESLSDRLEAVRAMVVDADKERQNLRQRLDALEAARAPVVAPSTGQLE